jgi:plastocyanin
MSSLVGRPGPFSKGWLLPILVIVISLSTPPLIHADDQRLGLGITFFDNAPPGPATATAPPGYNSDDYEWRPIWLSHKTGFRMPVYPELLGDYNYSVFSLSAWKNGLPNSCPWPAVSQYINDQSPSSVWRKYSQTLYHRINTSPVPQPAVMPEHRANPYAFGTMDADQQPANWYLDPMTKWLVENALYSGMPSGDHWSMYNDMLGNLPKLFPNHPLAVIIALAAEYWLIFEHDRLSAQLEDSLAENGYLLSSQHQSGPKYFAIYDPAMEDKNLVIEEAVPNFGQPSGVADADWVESTRDYQGGFTIRTGAHDGQAQQPLVKTIAVERSFTSGRIPFQFILNMKSDLDTNAASSFTGRFFLRVHLEPVEGIASVNSNVVEIDIAGLKSGEWMDPWTGIRDHINGTTISVKDNNGASSIVDLGANGRSDLLAAWNGEIVLRALDFGVNRFSKVEFCMEIAAKKKDLSGQTGPLGPAEQEQAAENPSLAGILAVQPVFHNNIAEAGPWKLVQAGKEITFTPDAGHLPAGADSVGFEWYLDEETVPFHSVVVENLSGTMREHEKRAGTDGKHTFGQPGEHTIWLKVDPHEPDSHADADLFNDLDKGISWDLCRVWVETLPDLPEGLELPPDLIFTNITFQPSSGNLLVGWNTNWPMTSRVQWKTDPPTGPQDPGEGASENENYSLETQHRMTIADVQPGGVIYVRISGASWGGNAQGHSYAVNPSHIEQSQWWKVVIPEEQTETGVKSTIYVYDNAGRRLIEIDPQTGQASVASTPSIPGTIADLSDHPDSGKLYAMGHRSPDTKAYVLEAATGVTTPLADTGLPFCEGLEYYPPGDTLLIGGRNTPPANNDSFLYIELDPGTGTIRNQTKTNIKDLDCLTYNPKTGELWAVDNQPGRMVKLWLVDPQTGKGTLKSTIKGQRLKGYRGIIGLAFTADGVVYAIVHKGKSKTEYALAKLNMDDLSLEILGEPNFGLAGRLHLSAPGCLYE